MRSLKLFLSASLLAVTLLLASCGKESSPAAKADPFAPITPLTDETVISFQNDLMAKFNNELDKVRDEIASARTDHPIVNVAWLSDSVKNTLNDSGTTEDGRKVIYWFEQNGQKRYLYKKPAIETDDEKKDFLATDPAYQVSEEILKQEVTPVVEKAYAYLHLALKNKLQQSKDETQKAEIQKLITRLAEVKSNLKIIISKKPSDAFNAAMEPESNSMFISPYFVRNMPEAAQIFVYAHEFGHNIDLGAYAEQNKGSIANYPFLAEIKAAVPVATYPVGLRYFADEDQTKIKDIAKKLAQIVIKNYDKFDQRPDQEKELQIQIIGKDKTIEEKTIILLKDDDFEEASKDQQEKMIAASEKNRQLWQDLQKAWTEGTIQDAEIEEQGMVMYFNNEFNKNIRIKYTNEENAEVFRVAIVDLIRNKKFNDNQLKDDENLHIDKGFILSAKYTELSADYFGMLAINEYLKRIDDAQLRQKVAFESLLYFYAAGDVDDDYLVEVKDEQTGKISNEPDDDAILDEHLLDIERINLAFSFSENFLKSFLPRRTGEAKDFTVSIFRGKASEQQISDDAPVAESQAVATTADTADREDYTASNNADDDQDVAAAS